MKERKDGMKWFLFTFVGVWTASVAAIDMATVRAVVLDDVTGLPLKGATLHGSFRMNNGIRIWTESPNPNVDKTNTDEEGRGIMRGKTNVGHAGCWVSKAPSGYYESFAAGSFDFKAKDIFGNWQPDNLVVTIALQRVEHPIPLFVRKVVWKDVNKGLLGLQGSNAVLRLDMFKGDWLPPYGHGETADMEILSEMRITGKERRFSFASRTEVDVLFYDLVQTIRPTGADDCISESICDPRLGIKIRQGGDEGRGGRIVLRQGDRKQFSKSGEWHSKHFTDADANRCATFRIRSRYDEKGNLVSAYYGKIYGDFKFEGHLDRGVISVRFLYYLNQTPLDRNLEWDMKNNLCPNPGIIGERRP